MEAEELALALKRLADWAERHAPVAEPVLRRLLRDHLGADPRELPVVTRPLELWDRPNLQVALDEWLEGRTVEVLGLPPMGGYRAGLAELVRGGPYVPDAEPGGVEYVTIPLGGDEALTCVRSGVWLVRDDEGPLVLMLKSVDQGFEQLELEAMGPDRARAEAVLDVLRETMARRNVYRGRVLELGLRHFHGEEGAPLTVRTLPSTRREDIVLPEGVLELVERQAFAMSRHAERLRASGRHLRRGLLLHGPPGVGKTLTAMYLATQMPERTVVLLTGQSLERVRESVDLATALQPAMVVLEDVDLVALDRHFGETNAVLFELLNAMDGLDEDHDLLFVLTTNRPEVLEPALASRPGRIDQAVRLPLPDADGRRRLLELYGRGLVLDLHDRDGLVAALEGSTPAFLREVLRRAALAAAEEGGEGVLRVQDHHLRATLDELRASGAELTQTLLGVEADGELDLD